jgi:hypothetical protein
MIQLFDEAEMKRDMQEFLTLYETRPLRENSGGMGATHMFGLYMLLRKIKPETVIESGVYKGLGTWLIRATLPDARIFCLDPSPHLIEWKDPQSVYIERDFACIDWSRHIDDFSRCLLFADDHQNAIRRMQEALWFGIAYVAFEDNYPTGKGDCYTLKTAAEGGAYPVMDGFQSYQASTYNWRRAQAFFETYEEMPPVCIPERTRWGDEWSPSRFETRAPLFADRADPAIPHQFLDNAAAYTWLCAIKLKTNALTAA